MSRAAKADTWMPLYIADYLRKTMHLTRDQHGGYMLLLMACWDRGGRLPNDPGQLAGIARATPAEWKKLATVLLPFFEVDGEFLVQGRVIEEREKAQRLSDARRESGSKGGRPRKQRETENESDGKPIGFDKAPQTETPTRVALPSPSPPPDGGLRDADASPVGPDAPTSDEPKAKPEPWEGDADFRALWDGATPQMRTRSKARGKLWPLWRDAKKRAGSGPIIVAALGRYLVGDPDVKRSGGPGLHVWLAEGKWEHWLEDGRPARPSAPAWPGPPEIRQAVLALNDGERLAVGYLDRCQWQEVPFRAVVAPLGVILHTLQTEAGDVFRRFDAQLILSPAQRGAA